MKKNKCISVIGSLNASDSWIKHWSFQPSSSDKNDLRPGNLLSSLLTQHSTENQWVEPYFMRSTYSESQNL